MWHLCAPHVASLRAACGISHHCYAMLCNVLFALLFAAREIAAEMASIEVFAMGACGISARRMSAASAACAVREIAAERASIGVFAMGAAHVASLRTACGISARRMWHLSSLLCYAVQCTFRFALCCAGDRCRNG